MDGLSCFEAFCKDQNVFHDSVPRHRHSQVEGDNAYKGRALKRETEEDRGASFVYVCFEAGISQEKGEVNGNRGDGGEREPKPKRDKAGFLAGE